MGFSWPNMREVVDLQQKNILQNFIPTKKQALKHVTINVQRRLIVNILNMMELGVIYNVIS